TSGLAVGSHSVTAVYGGDGNFTGGTSAPLAEPVSLDTTTFGLISSPNAPVFGQAVTFTAAVSAAAPGAGTPTGTITFMDGSATLGTGTLSGGQASFTTTSLTVATHDITAVYGGDNNFTGSTSAAVVETVQPVPLSPPVPSATT